MAAAAILDFWPMWILTVNVAVAPNVQPLYQIRWKYVQKWPIYDQKCDFQDGGTAILDFEKIEFFR